MVKKAYEADPEKERDRKRQEYAVTKESRGTEDSLEKFLDEGRYGPILPAFAVTS